MASLWVLNVGSNVLANDSTSVGFGFRIGHLPLPILFAFRYVG